MANWSFARGDVLVRQAFGMKSKAVLPHWSLYEAIRANFPELEFQAREFDWGEGLGFSCSNGEKRTGFKLRHAVFGKEGEICGFYDVLEIFKEFGPRFVTTFMSHKIHDFYEQ